jgi:thiol:disulfide interchange protein DsbA
MKQLFILLALLLALGACSKEEEAQAPVEDQALAETEAPADVAEETEGAVEETLEVVEESAAVEEESADEPIVLAQANLEEVAREWRFKENVDYKRLVPTQPTVGGADKIEVAELFMYSCPHCYTLDPEIDRWAAQLDPAVRFVRIPVIFNRVAQVHARLFYTAELLASNGTLKEPAKLHQAVFAEFHRRNNRLISEDSIARLFARFGISATDFEKSWNSFYVNQKMNTAQDLTRRYGVAAVPAVVVNGKYQVDNRAGMFDIINELLIREGLR